MEAELELSQSILSKLKDGSRSLALKLVQNVSDELKHKWSFIDPKDQNYIADTLFKCFACPHLPAQLILTKLMTSFLQQSCLDKKYDDLVELLVDHINDSDEKPHLQEALLLFIDSVNRLPFSAEFYITGGLGQLLVPLYNLFSPQETKQSIKEHCLVTLGETLRLVAWADGEKDELVARQMQDFSHWMDIFATIIQSDPKKNFYLKSLCIKVLTIIFRDFLRYSKQYLESHLPKIWKLLTLHLPIYIEVVIHQSPESLNCEAQLLNEKTNIVRMSSELLDFISSLSHKESLNPIIKTIAVLLISTLSGYALLPKSQEKRHREDATLYINEIQDDLYRGGVRGQAIKLINDVIEKNFEGEAAKTVFLVAVKMANSLYKKNDSKLKVWKNQEMLSMTFESLNLQTYQGGYESLNTQHAWKRVEGGLFILGSFFDDFSGLFQRDPKLSMDLSDLMRDIFSIDNFEALSKEEGFQQLQDYQIESLEGRALWAVSQLSGIIWAKDQLAALICKHIGKFLSTEQTIHQLSLRSIACRTLSKYLPQIGFKMFELEETINENSELKPRAVIKNICKLAEDSPVQLLPIPIEALQLISKLKEAYAIQIIEEFGGSALKLFREHHTEQSIGPYLHNMFKRFSYYPSCRAIFTESFSNFSQEVISGYFQTTNTSSPSTPDLEPLVDLNTGNELQKSETKMKFDGESTATTIIVDSSILQHVLEIINIIVREHYKEKEKGVEPTVEIMGYVMGVFKQLLSMLGKSDDLFLLQYGTTSLKTFACFASKDILAREGLVSDLLSVTKRLLLPTTIEASAGHLGNLIIQIFDKISTKIDTSVLMSVIEKIYKSRMPSIVQSLVIIFARLMHFHFDKILNFLAETSVQGRISLKILLDKWLLHQPLFRGDYTKNVTFTALFELFKSKDKRIESLMVIGYNPSHSNINSQVNAPFKILSTLLRFLENESRGLKLRFNVSESKEEEKKEYRKQPMDSGGRVDTEEDEDDDEEYFKTIGAQRLMGEEKVDVMMDEVMEVQEGDDEIRSLSDLPNFEKNFGIKESNDRGLADLETGSQVYLSEMLVNRCLYNQDFDIDEFDECEETTEEDLKLLKDKFAIIEDLKDHVEKQLLEFMKSDKTYIQACFRYLPKEDKKLGAKYLRFK